MVWYESFNDQIQFLKRKCDKKEASFTMNTSLGTKPEIFAHTTSVHRKKVTTKAITHRDSELFEYSTFNDI